MLKCLIAFVLGYIVSCMMREIDLVLVISMGMEWIPQRPGTYDNQ